MNDGSAKLIGLGDLFRHGGHLLVPAQPCSPYRYVEALIDGAVQRKFGLRKVVELGPGSDPALGSLDLDGVESALAIDYSQDALDVVKRKLGNGKVQCRLTDVMVPHALDDLNGQFDYLICNSLIEHVADDAALAEIMRALLRTGGYAVCTTVLHQRMYNNWDYGIGHYRRYAPAQLVELFAGFSDVQFLQTSFLQELSRPLFFSRVSHLQTNTLEENNRLTAIGHQQWGKVPYGGIWPALKYAMPVYLVGEWVMQYVIGGIAFVIGRK
jgi:ubiquinone/menaquinone biosynthesis C-methylase UbiE